LNDGSVFDAKVVIDAAGKLSRFGKLKTSPQFGVQFYETGHRDDAMDFWFFPDGYGGIVGIEGQRANACFLIRRDALHWYRDKPGCRITGPVAYRSQSSDYIAIGDAAGMIDPFCGEGMHHALDTGRMAAASVRRGLADGWSYLEMRRHYERERRRRWWHKRMLARAVRAALEFPRLRDAGLRMGAGWLVDAFWG